MKNCEKCLAKSGNFDFFVMTFQMSCGAETVKIFYLFRQNTYLRNKKHTLTYQGGIGYYKAVNYQPGS